MSQEETDRMKRDAEDEDVTAHRFVADEAGEEDDPERMRIKKGAKATDDDSAERMRRA